MRKPLSIIYDTKQLVLLTFTIFSILCISYSLVFAGIYTWTDKNGMFHATDDLSKAPSEYRKRTVHESDNTAAPNADAPLGSGIGSANKHPGSTFIDPITSMEFVLVKGGCFKMGNPEPISASIYGHDAKPAHEVCIDDFYIGKFLVTQGQWKSIMGKNPSRFIDCGDNCPVESVSWNDAQEFIRILTQRTSLKYRLPTEAEWEYAARSGGKSEKWAGTNTKSALGDYAWYSGNSSVNTIPHPVGQKKSNGIGIYDMSGSVWEWTADWYDEIYYRSSPKNNPQGPSSGSVRVLRGGANHNDPMYLETTHRYRGYPNLGASDVGFRIVRTP